MKLRRLPLVPFVVLALVSAAAACGDDDDAIVPPPADGGADTSTPVTPKPDASPTPGDASPPPPPPEDSGPTPEDSGPVDSGSDTGLPVDAGADADDAAADAAADADASPPTPVAPTITTTTLPNLSAGTAAPGLTLAATGDTPITYAVTAGALPAGMTLSTAGVYAGTPTQVGTFAFTVTATNATGTDTQALSQVVVEPPVDATALVTTAAGAGQIQRFARNFVDGAPAAVNLTGIDAADTLVSIDRRPQNGYLYAIARNAAGDVSLYSIHLPTLSANKVGTATFDTPVTGTTYGMNFNPTVDRIRVVTSTGQNFRMNPNTGAAVDSDAVIAGVQRDGNLNGGTSTLGRGAAYTKSIQNSDVTTLFTITGTSLYIQNPPNNGTLTTPLTLGGVTAVEGFDIPNTVTGTTGFGFASVVASGQVGSRLASVNLATGAVSVLGAFPNPVRGIALDSDEARTAYALNEAGTDLISFLVSSPATVKTTTITNIAAGEVIAGIDFRPATGQLMALGVNSTTDTATLYRLDPLTAVASAIGAAGGIQFFTGAGGNTVVQLPSPTTVRYGVNFNPSADRVRVVTSSRLNFRIHPVTGAAVDGDNGAGAAAPGVNMDGQLSNADGFNAVAYTSGPGSATTTEYGIDPIAHALRIVSAPNAGTSGTGIPIEIGGALFDFGATAGFDIPDTVTVTVNGGPPGILSPRTAFAVFTSPANVTGLYTLNLVTGAATLVGPIGTGTTVIRGLAIGR